MPDSVKTIQFLIAPVVMISACGLLCLALYNRLAAIVSRARAFHKERFYIEVKLASPEPPPDPVVGHLRRRFNTLEEQAARILSRARRVRGAILALLGCILCMLVSSLTLGAALVWPAFDRAALGLFLLGDLLACLGILLAISEVLGALDPVTMEYTAFEDHLPHA